MNIGVKVDKKLGKHFYYRADLLNGSGQNLLENDDQKDGALRVEAYPFEGLTLGAAGYVGLWDRGRDTDARQRSRVVVRGWRQLLRARL